jgi:hypothetical protein
MPSGVASISPNHDAVGLGGLAVGVFFCGSPGEVDQR